MEDKSASLVSQEEEHTHPVYLQNRELSWLDFNKRVLDQGMDPTVALLDRLTFVSIFSSNLEEFFMVRVGSLTDLSLLKGAFRDSKTNMTPCEQIQAIHKRCHELIPIQEMVFEQLRDSLAKEGLSHLRIDELSPEQKDELVAYFNQSIAPFLSPQIINARHPFPHLENGKIYVLVRLTDSFNDPKQAKAARKKEKNLGALGVTLGLIPLPAQCKRVITLPGKPTSFVLLEHLLEYMAPGIFSMYKTKHTNIICVTRNADLSDDEGLDEADDDYREHMKRILKKRARLAPVRLECERKLSSTMEEFLLERLNLTPSEVYTSKVPLDMSYAWGLSHLLSPEKQAELCARPQTPQWPAALDRKRSLIEQISEQEILLSYPYESMDAFIQLLREAANDPQVVSIKITLYRLASQSHLAEALIAAAENGKEVTALFELRARFDESNNIAWSQRFEEAGCKVIYGFADYKVHSKICCITRQTEEGVSYITQLGTGNYNEKTAKLYTDLSFITTNSAIGKDATLFFRNMSLENISDDYEILQVAPLQIKPLICAKLDEQIKRAQAGKSAYAFFKTNAITDKDVIEKIVEASQAGVKIDLLVRGISCILPGISGYTDNVRVVSIVGRLLEHSRIYTFGDSSCREIYLSSADLMTRNMDNRIEIAWPVLNESLKAYLDCFIEKSLADTAKLRELLPDGSYTPLKTQELGARRAQQELFNSQEYFTQQALSSNRAARHNEARKEANQAQPYSQGSEVGAPHKSESPQASGFEASLIPEYLEQRIESGELRLNEEDIQALEAALATIKENQNLSQVARREKQRPADPYPTKAPHETLHSSTSTATSVRHQAKTAQPTLEGALKTRGSLTQPHSAVPQTIRPLPQTSSIIKVENHKPGLIRRALQLLFGKKWS